MPDAHRLQRQRAIRQFLAAHAVAKQRALVDHLSKLGFQVTQSSVSRDLSDLGVVKRGGVYVVPPAEEVRMPGILDGKPAGPHLIVLKTGVGAAQLVGVQIDRLGLPGVVGTVAGDDTIFVATASRKDQVSVMRALGVSDE